MKKIKTTLASLSILFISSIAHSQTQTISATESGKSIYVFDIDQDNDNDIVSALYSENKLVWYENIGGGVFSSSILISDSVTGPYHVIAADLDNDGKQDIITANNGDSTITWFKNLGSGTFSSKITITNSAFNVESIDTADVDNDGDLDLLSGTYFPNGMVAWFENIGSGNFGPQQIISNSNIAVKTVVSSDLNDDSLPDVLVASFLGDVKWFKNLGGGLFDSGQNIGWSFYTFDACAGDIDADGDNDVVASNGAEIFIHENLGNGLFGNQPIVVTSTTSSYGGKISLFDIDSDGLLDILPAETYTYRVIYYKNLGALGFSPPIIIDSTTTDLCTDTHSADLDNDGNMDIIVSFEAVSSSDKLVWYKNNNTLLNVSEIRSTQEFVIYPNPSSENVTIRLKENFETIDRLSVFDILGNEVLVDYKIITTKELLIHVSNLVSGYYFFNGQTKSGISFRGKFMKE
jgi:hypothetical protein